jgi:hypothetical protein
MSNAMTTDVILVSMPFADVQRPSIALGLLRASLAHTDIRNEVLYANFSFAETIGLVSYQAMQSAPTDHLLGEWCFAGHLFPVVAKKDEEYLNLVLDVRSQGFPADLEQRKDLMYWGAGTECCLCGTTGRRHRRAQASHRWMQLCIPAALCFSGPAQANS